MSGLNCYNASGGICGVAAQDGLIQKCYNIAKVDTYTSNTYSLFDFTTNSYSNTMSGGICGALYLSTQVKNCYNTGDIHSYVNRDTTIVSPDAGDSIFDSIMSPDLIRLHSHQFQKLLIAAFLAEPYITV